MKRLKYGIISTCLIIALTFSLTACGKGNAEGNASESETSQSELTSLATKGDTEENVNISGAAVSISVLCGQLKNPHSLEIYSIKKKNVLGSYFYKINYSAENNLGGKVEDYFYVRTSTEEFEFSTSQFYKEGEDKTKKNYEDSDKEEVKVDVDKAMSLYKTLYEQNRLILKGQPIKVAFISV